MPLFFDYGQFAGAGETRGLLETAGQGAGWMVIVGSDTAEWSRQFDDAAADATVRGAAGDLYLYCLGRHVDDRVEVQGDAALVQRWRAAGGF